MGRVKLLALGFTLGLAATAGAQPLTVGQNPSVITLKDDDGGLVANGKPWTSESLKKKLNLLVYVDPDESDLNNDLTERLKKEAFDHGQFASVAVINMAATWKPNAIISSVLEGKQKDYPDTVYVKDYKGVLVKKWGLADDNYDVVLFGRKGEVLFHKDGKLTADEIEQVVQLIKSRIKP